MNLLKNEDLKNAIKIFSDNEYMIQTLIDGEMEYNCRMFVNGNHNVTFEMIAHQALCKNDIEKRIVFTVKEVEKMSLKEKVMIFHTLVNMY
jgi:hypothetical protein